MSNDTPNKTVEASKAEVIDLQAHARSKKPIPKGRRYKILIDRQHFVVNTETISGRSLLELAGKTPVEQFMISQKLHGGQVQRIDYDEIINLTRPGVERFITMPLDQTEGDGNDFDLPEDDKSHLTKSFKKWEAIKEGASNWLLLYDFEVPHGYDQKRATLALMIPPAYPDVQIDMAYFHPHLTLNSKKTVEKISEQQIKGQSFQRWSRHRKSADEWRSDVDGVGTHILQVTTWLEKETLA